jgi:hypothetical protein
VGGMLALERDFPDLRLLEIGQHSCRIESFVMGLAQTVDLAQTRRSRATLLLAYASLLGS